jgi:UDP-N-acetylmuramoylalanine--D-glutamate ligase
MTIALTQYAERPVAVLGLARSGLASAAALAAGGAHVFGWDDDQAKRALAQGHGILIAEPARWPLSELKLLVPSPGIPLKHPAIGAARVAGLKILGDIELLWQAANSARYVGITGTNGKSTTTALIGHILKRAGQRAEVGGNLGVPALSLKPLGTDGIYVLELSSYQLDLTERASLDIAVLLNITPDHLDRHGDMASYIAAKRKIFRPGRLKCAVIGIDEPISRGIAETLTARGDVRVMPVTVGQSLDQGVAVLDGILHEGRRAICDLKGAKALPGAHNWQNTGAAYAAVRALDLAPELAAEGLLDFPGLPHRIERIAEIDGLAYINDSKATNAEATARALACFDHIYWIAGGRAKAGGIDSLHPFFPRIAHAFLIGEAESAFASTLDGHVPYQRCGTLEQALAAAGARARREGRAGAVVLLSPACASFDQFANYEARGDAFRALVQGYATNEAAQRAPGLHTQLLRAVS